MEIGGRSGLGWGVFPVEKNKHIRYNVIWIIVFERRCVMNKRKLDSLLWENIPIDNFIVSGHSDIKQENLDDVFWDDVDGMNLSKALQAALTSTNNQLFYLQKQLSFYKKMVAEYSSASADVQQKIENAFQAMSSIGGIAAVEGM